MNTLLDTISDVRNFMYGGIATLPLSIAGTLLVLGLFTANYAILFFLIGYLILTPFVAFLLNISLDTLFSGSSYNIFKIKTSDVCRLVIPYTTLKTPVSTSEENVISSSWNAMFAFFIGYIFTNALQLFNRETPETNITVETSDKSDINTKVTNRKTQAVIAMISTIVFALIVFGYRFYSGCESTVGMILTAFIFTFAGNGWYRALSSIGQDRLSDLFGIANQLVSPDAITNSPIACIPIRT
jgi:hypothetical protein